MAHPNPSPESDNQSCDVLSLGGENEDFKPTDDENFDFDNDEIKNYYNGIERNLIDFMNSKEQQMVDFMNSVDKVITFSPEILSFYKVTKEISTKINNWEETEVPPISAQQEQQSESSQEILYANETEFSDSSMTKELFSAQISKDESTLSKKPEQETTNNKVSSAEPANILTQKIEEMKPNNINTCATCSKPKKVIHVNHLEKGQHISMPCYYFDDNAKKVVYEHHAIVIGIVKRNHPDITMNLIHFTKVGEKLTLCKEEKAFCLTDNYLNIVTYSKAKQPDEIIQRAEDTFLQNTDFKKYNLITKNCEHFATWCVVGEGQSFQVQSLQNKTANVVSILFGNSSKIAKYINRLISFSESKITSSFKTASPEYPLSGKAVVYLTYAIMMTVLHIMHYNDKKLCRACLKGKLLDIWLLLGAIEAVSLTPLILAYACPTLASEGEIPKAILEILLSASFQISVPRLRKALSSPFSVDCMKVQDLADIACGDIISIRYCGIYFKGIVTLCELTEGSKSGEITIVYYGVQSFHRTIVEKPFKVDKESNIFIFDCTPFPTYPAQRVVRRAKSRIGETKWNMFSNRTIHFLYWAKRKNDIHEMDTPSAPSSVYIEQREIHTRADLTKGDIVKCDVIGFISDTGIVSSITPTTPSSERKFEMEVYKLSFSGKVYSNKYTVDLNNDTVYVKIHMLCQNKVEHVKRALAAKTKGCSWLTTKRFIEHCIKRTSRTDQQT